MQLAPKSPKGDFKAPTPKAETFYFLRQLRFLGVPRAGLAEG